MSNSHLAAAGGRLALERRDPTGSGPLVICSPAMGDTKESFGPLADHLEAAGFRVALLDLRGHGESDATFRRYGDEATADDLLTAIDALAVSTETGSPEPVFLAGASMSAAAAVIAAGRRPEAVAGLILFGPFIRNGGGRFTRLALRLALIRPWGPVIWRTYSTKLWPGLGTHARTRAAELVHLLTRPGRWAAFSATTRTNHDVVTPWLSRVSAPTMVVMGAADPDWSDPAAEAAWIGGQLRGRTVLVHGVGHAPMLEAPDQVAAEVVNFLTETVHAARRA